MILTQCPVCAAPRRPPQPSNAAVVRRATAGRLPETTLGAGPRQALQTNKKGRRRRAVSRQQKYAAAVAVAAEACAEDTKGQTCYICTEAVHRRTKEGLVRGCACRGTAGFAHISCLAERVKILCDEAGENNLGDEALMVRRMRWHMLRRL